MSAEFQGNLNLLGKAKDEDFAMGDPFSLEPQMVTHFGSRNPKIKKVKNSKKLFPRVKRPPDKIQYFLGFS